jgi:hypothetical protein
VDDGPFVPDQEILFGKGIKNNRTRISWQWDGRREESVEE